LADMPGIRPSFCMHRILKTRMLSEWGNLKWD